jgi:uncharacterized 2Fe-2S/4Fe-4S cluster protein (DUF4445 family)
MTVRVTLLPLNKVIEVKEGTPLQDVLFEHGVEFPCGGIGTCYGCRIRLLEGELPVTPEHETVFTPEALRAGWRLACQYKALTNLTLELSQFETPILADQTAFEFVPSEGVGIAIDVGTTTLAAQLIDQQTGQVLAVETALNPQAQYGADIMSCIQYAQTPDHAQALTQAIRRTIGGLVLSMLSAAGRDTPIQRIVLCGNTVMHHLFCGLDTQPLSVYPFEATSCEWQTLPSRILGCDLPGDPALIFLPNLGSFVGSDLLAGILATRMHESEAPVALLDLGTNGEIVIGNRERILCTSTAAGPAFEGGRISQGMRAATGAIAKADMADGHLQLHVIGHGEARGICGSGLVDIVAGGLRLDWIHESGKFADGIQTLEITEHVTLTQKDIRELQLAKAAIAAGIRILLNEYGLRIDELQTCYLAGAFGNYLNPGNARWLGIFPFPIAKIVSAGNTALLGAKIALLNQMTTPEQYTSILKKIEHVQISSSPAFQEIYVEEMRF